MAAIADHVDAQDFDGRLADWDQPPELIAADGPAVNRAATQFVRRIEPKDAR